MSTTAGTSLKQWQDNWAECNRRYVAMATENESLQSQLAAANERADGLQRIVDEARAQKPVCITTLDDFCTVVAYPPPNVLHSVPLYAAPVPAQPAVVPEVVTRDAIIGGVIRRYIRIDDCGDDESVFGLYVDGEQLESDAASLRAWARFPPDETAAIDELFAILSATEERKDAN